MGICHKDDTNFGMVAATHIVNIRPGERGWAEQKLTCILREMMRRGLLEWKTNVPTASGPRVSYKLTETLA